MQVNRDATALLRNGHLVHDEGRHNVRHCNASSIDNVLLLAQVEPHECCCHHAASHSHFNRYFLTSMMLGPITNSCYS